MRNSPWAHCLSPSTLVSNSKWRPRDVRLWVLKDITLRMISTVSSLYVRIFYSFLIFIKTSQQPIKQYVHYIWWATHFARVKFLKTLGEYSRIIITLYNMQEKKNKNLASSFIFTNEMYLFRVKCCVWGDNSFLQEGEKWSTKTRLILHHNISRCVSV